MFAEIGVALLLFMAGLDFSVGQLRRVWKPIVLGGTGQVVLTGLAAGGVAAIGGGLPSGERRQCQQCAEDK